MTDPATRAAKVFLGVASVAGTLGGWAVLATSEPAPAPATPAGTAPIARPASPPRPAATAAPRPRRTVPVTFTRASR